MPFDIVAFGEATPGTGDPAGLAACLGDSLYYTNLDDLIVQEKAAYLLGLASFAEAQGARTVISQPSLPLNYEFLKCALLSAQSPSLAWTHLWNRPLKLAGNEKLNVGIEMLANEDAIVFLALGNGKITQAMVDAADVDYVITGEADTTLTAFTWTNTPVTWDQDLPQGTYSPVGMVFTYWLTAAPTMPAAARLIFNDPRAAAWRPGVLGCYVDKEHSELQTMDYFPAIHWPYMPELTFPHTQMPNIEVCSAEAQTDQNFQLFLKKVG